MKMHYNTSSKKSQQKPTTFGRRKSLESCWPMPNLSWDHVQKNKLSPSLRKITISDLKKCNSSSFVTKRRNSISRSVSPDGTRISFKDTLLRRRSSNVSAINQTAYLEILRDISIAEKQNATKDIKTTSRIKIGNDTDNDVNFEPLDISHAGDAVNNLRKIDLEPFMLSNEEVPEDMRYNDIDDDDMNLFDDIAAALGGL